MSRALAILILLTPVAALAQSTIELRSAARIAQGSAITLADVAVLSGPDAEPLASVVVVPESGARAGKVTVQEIRSALNERAKVNWGRITLRGSTCTLAAPGPAPKPASTAKPVPAPSVEPADSVRRSLSERIARLVQAETDNLRLTFSQDDSEILNLSMAGRTLEVKPTAASDKLPLALTLYEGERIVASKSIRVGVMVKRPVVIAAAAKSRGDTIERADVSIEEQWVGPSLRPASADAVIGSAAQGRIQVGQIIDTGDVAPAVIVNKGDQVTVSCVSGTVVVTTKARALSAGRTGEVIKFQGLEDKRVFSARMSGRGRAVVTAESGDPQIREPMP